MRSFRECIGADSATVMDARVTNATKTALANSKIIIEKMKIEFADLQTDIENMLDFGPTNSTDLGSTIKGVDFAKVLEDVFEKAEKMAVLARKISIRVKIHNTLFPTDMVDDLSSEDLDFLYDILS